jgi:two-component system response regulator PrrA
MSNTDIKSSPKILVVDDNEDVLAILRKRLGVANYEVLTANNAAVAMATLLDENQKPDVVVLDIMMPGISGYDVLDLIQKKVKNPPPVIVYSAYEDIDERVAGKEALVYSYVVKGNTGSLLIETIGKALGSVGRKIKT